AEPTAGVGIVGGEPASQVLWIPRSQLDVLTQGGEPRFEAHRGRGQRTQRPPPRFNTTPISESPSVAERTGVIQGEDRGIFGYGRSGETAGALKRRDGLVTDLHEEHTALRRQLRRDLAKARGDTLKQQKLQQAYLKEKAGIFNKYERKIRVIDRKLEHFAQ